MRDLRIFHIFEGSNNILRLFISLTGLQVHSPMVSPMPIQNGYHILCKAISYIINQCTSVDKIVTRLSQPCDNLELVTL